MLQTLAFKIRIWAFNIRIWAFKIRECMYMGARLTHTHTHTHTDDAAGSLARTPSWGHVNRFIYRMCCLYIECVLSM